LDIVKIMKEYNQIVNLVKFNVNFSKFIWNNDLLHQSPDYILEKYQHWIGFVPTVEHKIYTPDDMTDFFNKYWKIWRPDTRSINLKLKNILMYLYSTQDMNLLKMSDRFEEYIGPMNLITDETDKKGLHEKTNEFVSQVLEKNKDNVKIVLRNMKIENIII
jgi:hypothetical protein